MLAPIPPLRSVEARGRWEGPTAGGPRGHVSWKRNPQFLVHARSARPTRISIVLHRPDPTAADAEANAKGVRRKGISGRAAGSGEAELAKAPSRSSFTTDIGFTVAHAEVRARGGGVRARGLRGRGGGRARGGGLSQMRRARRRAR